MITEENPISSRRDYQRPDEAPDTEPASRRELVARFTPTRIDATPDTAVDSDPLGERPTLPSPAPLSLPPSSGRTFSLIEAAAKLKMAVDALRARCKRALRRAGTAGVGDLGGGFRAFKFGNTWRIRFPRYWTQ